MFLLAGHQRLSKTPEMSTKMAMTHFFWEVVARLWNLVRPSVVDLPGLISLNKNC
jgi:hypothetical protein